MEAVSGGSNARVDRILAKASEKNLRILRGLVQDVCLNKVCDHIRENVLWNSNAFIPKLGYTKDSFAYRHDSARGLVRYERPITEAIELTDIDGIQIVNPVQSGDVAPATSGPIRKIRFMLTNKTLVRFGKYIGQDVLWNCDEFVDEIGFNTRGNAFKSAFSRGLIEDNHNIDFTAAVGLTELDEMPTVNPLPADTPLEGNRQKKVKLMKTWNILHWISGTKTDRAEKVRTALWWMFFATDRRMWKMKLDSAEEKARQRDVQLETTIANKDAALSDKDAVIEEENASKKAVISSIHMPRPGNGREVFAVVFNPSIGHITSIRRTERGFPPQARDVPNARYKWKAALTEMVKQSLVRRDRVRNEAKPKSDLNTYRILNGGDIDAVIAAADCDEKKAK
ncbi:hypothetical protein CAPTEDRAFT_212313 [Capitella teleta]|uniref:Uncharacterized protein n=1 Tax=Capitella teleta TaxID=283909 RepID=R7V7Q0_CAPTE|nr:hypothetical protein CAPTEDRAFT_212313 [Capitella teleta]|eukprot:ELU14512.1 hypothetical protein CAPTEDRAFT_212313 [Capitella teleta]